MTDNRTESHYALHKLRCLLNIFVAIRAMGRRRAEHKVCMQKMEKFVKKFSQNTNKKMPCGEGGGGGKSYESTVNADLQLRGCKSVAGFF